MIRKQYNQVLLGMLLTSTSEVIRTDIDEMYRTLKNTTEDAAKAIFYKLRITYSTMTFKDNFKLVSGFLNHLKTSDFATQKRYYNGLQSAQKSPVLFNASMLLASGPDYLQSEVLRDYGKLTSFDGYEFYSNYQHLHAEHPKPSAAFIQPNHKVNENKSKHPRDPCPLCRGKHWKRECPKYTTQAAQTAHLATTYPDADLATADDNAWMAVTTDTTVKERNWYLDSGCTSHISRDSSQFKSLAKRPGPKVAGIANSVNASGVGTVTIDSVKLHDTLYVPEAPCNLVSISKMTQKSKRHIIFTNDGVYMTAVPEAVFKSARKIGSIDNGLYRLEILPKKETAMWTVDLDSQLNNESAIPVPTTKDAGDIWHARLGHPGRASYERLMSRAELPELPTAHTPTCQTCALSKGKIHKGSISTTKIRAPLELIQVDICGSFRYHDYIDSKYFLTIMDKYSSFYAVIPLVKKSQATQELKNWILRTETHFLNHGGYKVCRVRTDNGGEFTSKILHEFFSERGITHELTVPHSSSQNGGVERAHGVLQTKMRSLLLGGRVPPYLWSEALLCAAYLHNRLPILGKQGKIPFLCWNDIPTDKIKLNHLRTFGCAAYITMPEANRDGKLLPNSLKGVMVGYDSDRKAYRIYLPQTKTVATAKDVRFDENDFPLANTDASHQAYDFATGVLKGAPSYPPSPNIYAPTNKSGGTSFNVSSISHDQIFPAKPLRK